MTDLSPPTTQGPDACYARHLAEGVWRVQRCAACSKVIFFPRTACANCGTIRYTWFKPTGFGRIYATTVMHKPAQAGGDQHVCLVDLDEGFRMMSRVIDSSPSAVRIGDRVQAEVAQVNDAPLVVFRKIEEAA